MMFGKTVFFAAFVAVAQVVSAGAQPGCLLGAVNTAKDPSDVAAVCKNKDITKEISNKCGGDSKDALSSFADICNKAGVKISTDVVASGTASASLSPTNSANGTSGGLSTIATPTGSSPTGGAASSGTSTGKPAISTGAAGRIEVGVMAAFVGGLGVMAAAL